MSNNQDTLPPDDTKKVNYKIKYKEIISTYEPGEFFNRATALHSVLENLQKAKSQALYLHDKYKKIANLRKFASTLKGDVEEITEELSDFITDDTITPSLYDLGSTRETISALMDQMWKISEEIIMEDNVTRESNTTRRRPNHEIILEDTTYEDLIDTFRNAICTLDQQINVIVKNQLQYFTVQLDSLTHFLKDMKLIENDPQANYYITKEERRNCLQDANALTRSLSTLCTTLEQDVYDNTSTNRKRKAISNITQLQM